MEHISNEQKAKEFAKHNRLNYIEGEIGWGATIVSSEEECYESALQAMQWKDEKHKQEKQQLIDKAADFISKHFYIGINNHITSNENYYSLTELIRDFTNSIKS